MCELTELTNLSRRLALAAWEHKIKLFPTLFYNLHIISIEKFHQKSICHKVNLHLTNAFS